MINIKSQSKSSLQMVPGTSVLEKNIEFHADDYALFPRQSEEILDCYREGCLNAVSIMPNSMHLSECMEMIRPFRNNLKITIHLNFLGGCSVSNPNEVGRLVNNKGVFCLSFGQLLFRSFLPWKGSWKTQIKQEIRAQIYRCLPYLEKNMPLRIDGHAHWHMLPIVFDSLMEVIQEERLRVAYIRMPKEKLSFYFRMYADGLFIKISFINLIKAFVLNMLVLRNQRKHYSYLWQLEKKIFLGVVFSGNMFYKNVKAALPYAIQHAANTGQEIEILAHPGGVYYAEDVSALTFVGDKRFLTSEARLEEKEMFYKMHQSLKETRL